MKRNDQFQSPKHDLMISQIHGESQHDSESEKKGQESEMKISPSTKKTGKKKKKSKIESGKNLN